MTTLSTLMPDQPAEMAAIHMPMPRVTVRRPRGSDYNRLAYQRSVSRIGESLMADGRKVHGVVRVWGTSHGKLLPITDPIAWGPGQEAKNPQAAVADLLFNTLQGR